MTRRSRPVWLLVCVYEERSATGACVRQLYHQGDGVECTRGEKGEKGNVRVWSIAFEQSSLSKQQKKIKISRWDEDAGYVPPLRINLPQSSSSTNPALVRLLLSDQTRVQTGCFFSNSSMNALGSPSGSGAGSLLSAFAMLRYVSNEDPQVRDGREGR